MRPGECLACSGFILNLIMTSVILMLKMSLPSAPKATSNTTRNVSHLLPFAYSSLSVRLRFLHQSCASIPYAVVDEFQISSSLQKLAVFM